MARPWVDAAGATFDTYVDPTNLIGQAFGYQAIPVGIFVKPGGEVAYLKLPFSIDRTQDVADLEAFLRDESPAPADGRPLEARAEASATFAAGVDLLGAGDRESAVERWRTALAADPDSFIIRKQIWAVEHPERFYPAIDTDWQREVLKRERGSDSG